MNDFFTAIQTIRLVQDNLVEDLKTKYVGKTCSYWEDDELVLGTVKDIDAVYDIIEITISLLEGHSYKPSGFIVYLNALEVEFI